MPAAAAVESRKRRRINLDDDTKKRGRPRVDGQDETAADRRRTQIRLAQRAYRARKENTISSLRNQVDSLQKTIEEMNKSFISFHDKVVSSELLRENPGLGHQLRQITEQFFLLAKSSTSPSLADSAESEHEDDLPSPEPVTANDNRRYKDIGLGYVQYIETETSSSLTPPIDSADVASDLMPLDVLFTDAAQSKQLSVVDDFNNFNVSRMNRSGTPLSYFTRLPTPPTLQNFMESVNSVSQGLKAPYTFSIEESTFARRIHRASLERGYHILASSSPSPELLGRVFRLSLLYHTRESLLVGIQNTLMKDTSSSLENYRTPFIHLGNAGMHFGKRQFHNSYIVKPSSALRRHRLQNAQTGFDAGLELDIDLTHEEYSGDWYDSTDLGSYMEEMGVDIEPRAVFAEAKVPDDGPLIKLMRQNGSALPPLQTKALDWTDEPNRKNSIGLFPELGLGSDLNERMTADMNDIAGWIMGSGDRTPEFSKYENQMRRPWDSFQSESNSQHISRVINSIEPKMRNITIDVGSLIESIISRGICLGRAPGYRKRDVERALLSSIIQVV